MVRWIVAGLFVLNVLLGVGVYLRLDGDKPALAQVGGAVEHVRIAGNSGGQAVVYDLNVGTGQLSALKTDPVTKTTDVVATADVSRVLKSMVVH